MYGIDRHRHGTCYQQGWRIKTSVKLRRNQGRFDSCSPTKLTIGSSNV
ncbi:hypothetical protein [Escherichia phage pEC-N1203-2Af.1]|nr:hypothetical protein [Escherichia phage pEC-N1203-2Af.1]